MTELTVLNGAAIQSLLTIPMAVRAVEQAYLEKSTGGAALWPMVFHEFPRCGGPGYQVRPYEWPGALRHEGGVLVRR